MHVVPSPVKRYPRKVTVLLWFFAILFLVGLLWFPAERYRADSSEELPDVAQASDPVNHTSFETVLRKPDGPPMVSSGLFDSQGQSILIPCNTCHTTSSPNTQARLGTPLTQFHQNLRGQHVNLTCISCHHPQDGYQSLRLADDSKIRFPEVMQLCA
ncbi:MAG TPA: hypothetical protein PKA06_16785 [Gemmatales bacterium]|nr:hypothetical protein [Gemmatales bacterium]